MSVLSMLKRKPEEIKIPKLGTSTLKPLTTEPAPVLGRVAGLQKESMVSPATEPKSALLRKMLGLK